MKRLLICLLLLGFLMTAACSKKFQFNSEVKEEQTDQPLIVEGQIPEWLAGTLVRNGPIKVSINGKSNTHWFDGLAMLHAFYFDQGKVHYSNRFIRSNAYHTVFEEGSLHYEGFAVDPCRSLFKRFFTLFFPEKGIIQNANVNVAKIASEYVALTEVPLPVRFDIQTLETLGVLNYQDELPKERCWESAHPHYMSQDRCTYNYLVEFGEKSYYNLYKVKDNLAQRQTILKIAVDLPAYMHSFAVTENYIILTEFPFVINPIDLINGKKAFIKNFSWKPERGTCLTVINRKQGKLVGHYFTKPFFAFHHANAFERDDQLHLDIITYKDASILTGHDLDVNVESRTYNSHPSRLERFSLSLKSGEIKHSILFDQESEFPRINDHYDGQPYRFVYMTRFGRHLSNQSKKLHSGALYKINTETKELLSWEAEGFEPGEPIFIPSPNAKEEDDGVVLSVIINPSTTQCYLLALDGKSFKEIGRAKVPLFIPEGLHGQFFSH